MKRKRYDIVVIGCGPSGAMTGKFAALGGAETLIVEERRQIGFPVHDSMSIIFSQSEMEEVTGEKIETETIYSQAKGLAYISPSGNQGKPCVLPDGIFINRQLFEKSLAISAVRAGAEILLHSRVVDLVRDRGAITGVVVGNGEKITTIPCSLAVIAEGSYRRVARLAGAEFPPTPANAVLGCEFVGVKSLVSLQNIGQIYLDETGQRMYRYVVPYAQDRFSIGNSFSPAFAKERKSLKQRFDDFLRHLESIGMYDFSRASPVNLMCGGRPPLIGVEAPLKLASDGIILVGDAAGELQFGCRSAGVGLMLGACWTGRSAGRIAAEAVRKGEVSGRSLNGEYRNIIGGSLKGEDRAYLLDSLAARKDLFALDAREQDRAIDEIGQEVAGLHLCARGALDPVLRSHLATVRNWLKERKGR